jgi:hypothetical protein
MKDNFGMKLRKHLEWKTIFLEYDALFILGTILEMMGKESWLA